MTPRKQSSCVRFTALDILKRRLRTEYGDQVSFAGHHVSPAPILYILYIKHRPSNRRNTVASQQRGGGVAGVMATICGTFQLTAFQRIIAELCLNRSAYIINKNTEFQIGIGF